MSHNQLKRSWVYSKTEISLSFPVSSTSFEKELWLCTYRKHNRPIHLKRIQFYIFYFESHWPNNLKMIIKLNLYDETSQWDSKSLLFVFDDHSSVFLFFFPQQSRNETWIYYVTTHHGKYLIKVRTFLKISPRKLFEGSGIALNLTIFPKSPKDRLLL